MNLFAVIPQDLSTTASPTFAGVNIGDFLLLDNSDVLEISYDGARAWYFNVDNGVYGIGDIDGYNHFNKIEIDDTTIYLTTPSTTVSGTLSVAGITKITDQLYVGNGTTIDTNRLFYINHTWSTGSNASNLYSSMVWNSDTNSSRIDGMFSNVLWHPGGGIGTADELNGMYFLTSFNWGSVNADEVNVMKLNFNMQSGYTGDIINAAGLRIVNLSAAPGAGGSITNKYGIYIENVSGGTTLNHAIYTNAGTVRFGDDVVIADGKNIVLDTSTGTQIGTGTSQLLGFYGAT
ncbi:MAG: hypothetical protein PHG61_08105, partial [Candidatus Marinimicrobia bacterium]|nr:hypothetical protein [Candidatus Neomarinimicrobiota bacterium]